MDDFDRALASFDGAIATEPSNPIGYLARSILYARRGNNDKQQRDYQQALRLNPNVETLWTEIAQWFDKEQSTARSGRDHSFRLNLTSLADPQVLSRQFVTRNAGKNYHELFQEGQIAHNEGNYDDEIALWNDVVAMNLSAIQVAPAIMNRGNADAAKGDLDKAMQDYNDAINLDPKNAGTYVNRALELARGGDYEAAMKDYAMAIALNPRQWQAYFNRAAELKHSGKLREAVADLSQVMNLNPEFVGAYVNRGSIYVRQGELDKAIADYSDALQRDSNLTDIYISRAELFVRKKKYQQAVSDLQTAVQMKTKRPEAALNSLAWLRATCPKPGMRDGKEAVQLAVKACDLSEWKDWGTIDTLAAAYAETGDFDRATNYQQRVLQMVKPPTDQRKLQQRLALYREHKPYREAANED